jgi:hypothetical protein
MKNNRNYNRKNNYIIIGYKYLGIKIYINIRFPVPLSIFSEKEFRLLFRRSIEEVINNGKEITINYKNIPINLEYFQNIDDLEDKQVRISFDKWGYIDAMDALDLGIPFVEIEEEYTNHAKYENEFNKLMEEETNEHN